MNKQLAHKLYELPKSPGVYFHKNASGEVIYIGKAAILKNRVRQYFHASRLRDAKTEALVAEIADIEWMTVDSEIEALFLEAEMVRRYMPRYNILLRDDKSLGYIRIDRQSEYPTVTTTRHPLDDGAEYFGPYLSLYNVREALTLLRRIFPFATHKANGQKRASLHYYIGLDPGLETGKTSLVEYRANLRRLIAVIKGKKQTIIRELERTMRDAAQQQQFEVAARLRNQIRSLRELDRQVLFSDKEFMDISKDHALVQLQELLGLETPPERIEGFDISHMSGTNVVASMVVFVNGVSYRSEYRKFKLSVQRNDDYANMREIITRRFSTKNRDAWGVPDLVLIDGGAGQLVAAATGMHAQGVYIPIIGIAKREEQLVVHDTESAVNITPLMTRIAQPEQGIAVTIEGHIYTINLHVGQMNAGSHSKNLRGGVTMSRYSDTIKLIQRIRDEAHRFAVSYHSTLKRRTQMTSMLDAIPGVGSVTRKKLMRRFGSTKGVLGAQESELVSVVGSVMGKKIYAWLHTHTF